MNSYGFIGVFCRKGGRVFTRRAGKSNTEFVFTESAEEVRAAKNVPREEHPASREPNESTSSKRAGMPTVKTAGLFIHSDEKSKGGNPPRRTGGTASLQYLPCPDTEKYIGGKILCVRSWVTPTRG